MPDGAEGSDRPIPGTAGFRPLTMTSDASSADVALSGPTESCTRTPGRLVTNSAASGARQSRVVAGGLDPQCAERSGCRRLRRSTT